MRSYTLTGAAAFSHVPNHPDRTARQEHRGVLDFDVTFKEWTSRKTWTTFEESERGADTDSYADRTLGGGDFDGTDDYNERVLRDDANHRKHVARVLREEGA